MQSKDENFILAVEHTFILQCWKCGRTDIPMGDDDKGECPTCNVPAIAVFNSPDGQCRECKLKEHNCKVSEIFSISDSRLGKLHFDIGAMRKKIGTPPEKSLSTIPDHFVAKMLQVNITEPAHYKHVDDGWGLVVELKHGKEKGLMLIDGSHRAAKALTTGQPFKAIVVRDEFARQFLLDEHEVVML